jgi:hypothetical protein
MSIDSGVHKAEITAARTIVTVTIGTSGALRRDGREGKD